MHHCMHSSALEHEVLNSHKGVLQDFVIWCQKKTKIYKYKMWPTDYFIIFSMQDLQWGLYLFSLSFSNLAIKSGYRINKCCSILSVAEVPENQWNIYFLGLILGYSSGVVLTCLCRRRCWPAHHIPETRSSASLCPHCSYNQNSCNMHISDNYVHTCNCRLICKTTTSYLENCARSYQFNRPQGHPFDSRLPAIFIF